MIEEEDRKNSSEKTKSKGKKRIERNRTEEKKRSLNIPDLRSGRPKPSQASPMPVMEPEEPRASVHTKDFDDLIVQEETDKEPKEIFEPVQPKSIKEIIGE